MKWSLKVSCSSSWSKDGRMDGYNCGNVRSLHGSVRWWPCGRTICLNRESGLPKIGYIAYVTPIKTSVISNSFMRCEIWNT